MVDGHIATASTRGDNYHLDLDGILFLGAHFKRFLQREDLESNLSKLSCAVNGSAVALMTLLQRNL